MGNEPFMEPPITWAKPRDLETLRQRVTETGRVFQEMTQRSVQDVLKSQIGAIPDAPKVSQSISQQPCFDIGFTQSQQVEIPEQDVEFAVSTIEQLRDKAIGQLQSERAAILGELLSLRNRVTGAIQDELDSARELRRELTNRIETAMVGELDAVMELSSPILAQSTSTISTNDVTFGGNAIICGGGSLVNGYNARWDPNTNIVTSLSVEPLDILYISESGLDAWNIEPIGSPAPACIAQVPASVGQVIIRRFFQNPFRIIDAPGAWVTVKNATPTPTPTPIPTPTPTPTPIPSPDCPTPIECPEPEECPTICFFWDPEACEIICDATGECTRAGLVSLGPRCPDTRVLLDLLKDSDCIDSTAEECELCIDCAAGVVRLRKKEDDEDISSDLSCVTIDGSEISFERLQERIRQCQREQEEEPERPLPPIPPISIPPTITCDIPSVDGITGQQALPRVTLFGFSLSDVVAVILRGITTNAFAILQPIRIRTSAACNEAAIAAIQTGKVLVGLVNTFTFGALGKYQQILTQQENLECPTQLPSDAEARAAYLANEIPEEVWQCWTAASDKLPNEAWRLVQAARQKLSPRELLTLWKRKKITAQEYVDRIRELGFIRRTDAQDIEQLGEQIPNVPDIIRMMVRDADDNEIAQKFGMDDLFNAKFAQQLREWADNQQIPEQVMRYQWRSHWQIPSPTQLFEFFQRLTRLPNQSLGEFLADRGVNAGDIDPTILAKNVSATPGELADALVQQDILPFWIPKFLAVAFEKLTRRDLVRARRFGVISHDEAIKGFQEIGLTPRDANALTDLAEQERDQLVLRSKWITAYSQSHINFDQFQTLMQQEGWKPKDIELALERATILRTSNTIKSCVKAIKRRYMIGDVKRHEVEQELIARGFRGNELNEIIAQFECEKAARGKKINASVIWKLLSRGVITRGEALDRLEGMGYNSTEAILLLRSFERTLSLSQGEKGVLSDYFSLADFSELLASLGYSDQARATLIAAIQAKKREQEKKIAEAQRKEQERQAKQAAASAERAAKQIAQQAERAKRENEKRATKRRRIQKMLVEASSKMAERGCDSLPECFARVSELYQSLVARRIWIDEEVAQKIVKAIGDEQVTDFQQLANATLILLQVEIPLSTD